MTTVYRTILVGIGATFVGDLVSQCATPHVVVVRRRARSGAETLYPTSQDVARQHAESDAEDLPPVPQEILRNASVAQRLTCGLDTFQAIRLGLISGFWAAPQQWAWYHALFGLYPDNQLFPFLFKVALTQTVFTAYLTSTMLALDTLTKSTSLSTTGRWFGPELLKTLKRNWKVWTVVTSLNIYFVPVSNQAVVDQLFAMVWAVCCSCVSGKQVVHEVWSDAKAGNPTAPSFNAEGAEGSFVVLDEDRR